MTIRRIEAVHFLGSEVPITKELPSDQKERLDGFFATTDLVVPQLFDPWAQPWKSCDHYIRQMEGGGLRYRDLLAQFEPKTVELLVKYLAFYDRDKRLFGEFECTARAAWEYSNTLGPWRGHRLKKSILNAYLQAAESACHHAIFFGKNLSKPQFVTHASFEQVVGLMTTVEFFLGIAKRTLDLRDIDDLRATRLEIAIAMIRKKCAIQAYELTIKTLVERRIGMAQVYEDALLTEAEIAMMLGYMETWAEQGKIPSERYERDRAVMEQKLSDMMQSVWAR